MASKRDYAQAADEFSKAAGAGAGWEALSGQALCLYKMGRLSQALEAASAAVACAPSLPRPHFISGLVRAEAGLHDDAVGSYDSAERLGFPPFAVCYHRAAAHFLAGRLAEAESDLERASTLQPSSAAVFHNLAVVRIRRAKWSLAAQAFMKCAQLDPAALPRYQQLILEIGRAEACEEFHFRGHRIKNMLALMADTCRRAIDEAPPDDPVAEKMKAFNPRFEKIFAEMSELLMYVKREPLELDVWDIRDILESALVSAGDALIAVKVEKEYASDIPGIVCDAHLLGEAFLNIIINASEAMPAGGTLFVRASASPEGKVRVEFEDTGGGIKVSPPSRVFQFAFTTKSNGTGLGLCQAARAVADHTGAISVENGALGARFIIVLPFAPRIGESMQDIGLKIDLSEDISGLTFAASPLENRNPEMDRTP